MTDMTKPEKKKDKASNITFVLRTVLILYGLQTVLTLLNSVARVSNTLWLYVEWNLTELVSLLLLGLALNALAGYSKQFRNAGAMHAFTAMALFLLNILPEDALSVSNQSIAETVLIALWFLLRLAAEYNEAHAHAELLQEGNPLAKKWKVYWQCFAAALAGLMLFLLLAPKYAQIVVSAMVVFGGLLLVLRLLKLF